MALWPELQGRGLHTPKGPWLFLHLQVTPNVAVHLGAFGLFGDGAHSLAWAGQWLWPQSAKQPLAWLSLGLAGQLPRAMASDGQTLQGSTPEGCVLGSKISMHAPPGALPPPPAIPELLGRAASAGREGTGFPCSR